MTIPPGTYKIKSQGNFHLHLADVKGLDIDATGATIVFQDPATVGILLENCENVTLRGATLIHDPVSFSQGTLDSVGLLRNTLDVTVAKGYPTALDDRRIFPGELMVGVFDAATRKWKTDTKDLFVKKVDALGDGKFRFTLVSPIIPGMPVGSGDLVAWRGVGAPDISVYHGSHIAVSGVTIESGAGFGVYEDGGAGDNHYSYTIKRGPRPLGATEDPLLAENADGFHSNGVRKGPTLENCSFEFLDDDGVAIHGVYARVLGGAGKQVLIGNLVHPFCLPGDTLRFADATGAAAGEAKVVSVEPQPGYHAPPAPPALRLFQNPPTLECQNVTLDKEIPVGDGWMVWNADACGNGFTVRNCTVRDNRARGMLIKAGDGTIEGSTVDGSTMGGIVVSPEMEEWNEAGGARNLVLKNNIIRHAAIWRQGSNPMAGAMTIAAYQGDRYVPLPGIHDHITLTGNRFEENDGTNLLVTSTRNIDIAGTTFLRPMRQAAPRGEKDGVDPGALIWLSECDGVKITGTTVTEPGPALKKQVVTAGKVVGTGF
jgi:hypothetical protein